MQSIRKPVVVTSDRRCLTSAQRLNTLLRTVVDELDIGGIGDQPYAAFAQSGQRRRIARVDPREDIVARGGGNHLIDRLDHAWMALLPGQAEGDREILRPNKIDIYTGDGDERIQ